ncbi:hypothetical protein C8N35_103259 [Breoghania corrubedonensis]|uniref:Uncharacterized protein n=1 Tax=Breoghania corrubedonensis TaxID=665038 RepID=A0A2T5VBG0_9HYPH|nr:hypothetical protein C8N35_103259 [Breoghania corrubedonensis]
MAPGVEPYDVKTPARNGLLKQPVTVTPCTCLVKFAGNRIGIRRGSSRELLILNAKINFSKYSMRKSGRDKMPAAGESAIPAPLRPPPGDADQTSRATWNGAQDCVTGMISSALTLTCGGCVATQKTVSAISSG